MRGRGSAGSVGFWWKKERESRYLYTQQEGIMPQVWLVGTYSFLITEKCFHIIIFCVCVYKAHKVPWESTCYLRCGAGIANRFYCVKQSCFVHHT